jgi:hypothetical protein
MLEDRTRRHPQVHTADERPTAIVGNSGIAVEATMRWVSHFRAINCCGAGRIGQIRTNLIDYRATRRPVLTISTKFDKLAIVGMD